MVQNTGLLVRGYLTMVALSQAHLPTNLCRCLALLLLAALGLRPEKEVLEGSVEEHAEIRRGRGHPDRRGDADDGLRVIRMIEGVAHAGRDDDGDVTFRAAGVVHFFVPGGDAFEHKIEVTTDRIDRAPAEAVVHEIVTGDIRQKRGTGVSV